MQGDGSRLITFPNGTRKHISTDGSSVSVQFFNGDTKHIKPDGSVVSNRPAILPRSRQFSLLVSLTRCTFMRRLGQHISHTPANCKCSSSVSKLMPWVRGLILIEVHPTVDRLRSTTLMEPKRLHFLTRQLSLSTQMGRRRAPFLTEQSNGCALMGIGSSTSPMAERNSTHRSTSAGSILMAR